MFPTTFEIVAAEAHSVDVAVTTLNWVEGSFGCAEKGVVVENEGSQLVDQFDVAFACGLGTFVICVVTAELAIAEQVRIPIVHFDARTAVHVDAGTLVAFLPAPTSSV